MAEAAPGVVEQVKKAPSAVWGAVKKYWFIAPIVAVTLVFTGMAIKPWFTTVTTTKDSATKGDKLPKFLRDFLRMAGFLIPVGYCLLSSDVSFAGVHGNSIQCCAEQASGWFSQVYGYLAALLGTGVAFGISQLTAPDVLDGKTSNEGNSLTYTPGGAQEMSMFMRTGTKNTRTVGNGKQAPLIAVDSTLAIDTTIEQVSTGTNPLVSQDLSRLLSYLEISSPFHGTLLDKVTGTGPILDLVIDFIGQGFARSGDAPTVTITVPGSGSNDVPVTKYFTFPWAQRYLDDPSKTTPWLKSLDNAQFKAGIAANTALAAVSTGASSTGASYLRLATSYVASPLWRQTYLPYWRLDTPASGQDGLVFQNFGGTGPMATKAEDIVHTVGQLSNLAGLPGNLTFNTISNIIAPAFGLDDVQNIDQLVKARLGAQFFGRIGNYDYSTGGNHRYGAVNNGMALDKLLFLLLRQPSLDLNTAILPRFGSSARLPLREVFSSPRSGADAFIIGSLRELSSAKMQEQSRLAGGLMPTNMKDLRSAFA